jgi:uncharacterized DUF497 family protein
MAIRFEWDPRKAQANWHKHKVSFEQARDVFRGATALDEPDEREDYGEERCYRIGSVDGRLLFVSYTERIDEHSGEETIPIISARPADRREGKRYHEAEAAKVGTVADQAKSRSQIGGEAGMARVRCPDRRGHTSGRPQRP